MISVNISTIKQYFWYYDNFNKTYKIGDKYILPVLKMKEKYYVFHNKSASLFDELTLSSKQFVTYDKQYSYKAIDETTTTEDIILEFGEFICVFIMVDDNLKWTIEKNTLLVGNSFYEQSIADDDLIQFNFVIKKKQSKEVILSQPPSHNTSTTSVSRVEQLIQEVTDNYVGDCVDTYTQQVPDPFWDDAVLIDYNSVYF